MGYRWRSVFNKPANVKKGDYVRIYELRVSISDKRGRQKTSNLSSGHLSRLCASAVKTEFGVRYFFTAEAQRDTEDSVTCNV
jgi:hypothetical protein